MTDEINSKLSKISDKFSEDILEEINSMKEKATLSDKFRAYLKIIEGKIDLMIINGTHTLTLKSDELVTLSYVVRNFLDFANCVQDAMETIVDQNEYIQKVQHND